MQPPQGCKYGCPIRYMTLRARVYTSSNIFEAPPKTSHFARVFKSNIVCSIVLPLHKTCREAIGAHHRTMPSMVCTASKAPSNAAMPRGRFTTAAQKSCHSERSQAPRGVLMTIVARSACKDARTSAAWYVASCRPAVYLIPVRNHGYVPELNK